MAPAVVHCDGCSKLEDFREEWRVCGSGTRWKKMKHGLQAADDI